MPLGTRCRPITLVAVALGLLVGCSEAAQQQSASETQDCVPGDCQTDLLLHVPSPDWEDQIIYFLMTDRFDDGDPTNNDLGLGEYDPTREHYYSGGDIQGIIDRLDYIEGLGATAVWATPLVLNQWRSQTNDFTGYGGYYAVDFEDIDPHNGTLADYQSLSDTLHRRGMFLIKDIVVNHTGFFFGYDGPYNPENTAENFKLLEDASSRQPAPVTPPFDLINRLDPSHYEANIYNWTPTIVDYQGLGEKQFTHQLAGLADINTKNPAVIDAFKSIYGDWIEKAGVDAFRIDTVRYVEPEFFREFVSGQNGIQERAAATGRDDFLLFGEVLDYSRPFENMGEQALARYLSDDQGTILPAVISFPLKQDIKSIFAEGKAPHQLAYRLQQHMEMYDNPYITPTLIDNHDVARFLSTGSLAGFQQAFAFVFTIPGIPTIYQGSAQGFTETRQAMFAGGYLADQDAFNTDTELYRFIARLSKLRTTNVALRRGSVELLASNEYEAGLLAFRRAKETQTLDVIYNTSDQRILIDDLTLPGITDGQLTIIFDHQYGDALFAQNQRVTAIAPARSMIVVEAQADTGEANSAPGDLDNMEMQPVDIETSPHTDDIQISGRNARPNAELMIVKNGLIDNSDRVVTDATGAWTYSYGVVNLGAEAFYLVAFDPETKRVSNRLTLRTLVEDPQFSTTVKDPEDDDTGPMGTYTDLQQSSADGQKDILGIQATAGGDILKLDLTMRAITTDWLPPNGFDNVAFNVFFDVPDRSGATQLPQLNASVPEGMDWDFGHVVFGWGNTFFSSEDADADRAGKRYASAPEIHVDKDRNAITFTYDGSDFGQASWEDVEIYVATWDIAGEGAYVKLQPEPSDWTFGGGAADDPKVFDDTRVSLGAQD